MQRLKKIISAVLSVILATICTLGVFISGGYSFASATPASGFSVDQKDCTVKNSKQQITGKINFDDKNVKVTYEVYSDIDEGELSFKGEADVSSNTFTVDDFKLKPHGNRIILTAETADGKTERQTININYDSSSIKNTKLKNVAKVRKDSEMLYINNNLLVYFEENISDEARQDVIDMVGGKCVGYINGINMWQVEVAPASFDALNRMAEELTAMDEVFYAGCNRARAAAPMVTPVTPNDPWHGASWNEYNPQSYNWSIEAVQALSAWGYDWAYNHINIGIVDAGVDNVHEDLAGKVFFPDAASAEENDPTDNHGTHVAGIMGAIPNNNKGVTGILWDTNMYCVNWDVLVGTDANLFAGLTETVQAGAKVVNFSLGLANDISGEGAPGVNPEVISYAHQSEAVMTPLLNAGYDFIVVESAGNGQGGYSQDAIYNGYFCSVTYTNLLGSTAMVNKINERIIIVGSAYRAGTLSFTQASTSNAGPQVDICAPGVDVYSCYAGDSYGNMSGTSMASPVAAAVAALAWSVNPVLTGSQVRSIVLNNTSYTVADNTSYNHPLVNTYPMVNAKLAVEAALATKSPDYSAVNTAVAAANACNSALYTPASWANLTAAVNAVDYGLQYINQPQIDDMAQNINAALNNLVLKTVSYTVEYRLNSADGSRLAADKIGTGQVTSTVNESAEVITGYSAMSSTKSIQLALENNLTVFIYIVKPEYSAIISTYKNIGGQLIPVNFAKAGDEITVTVTPSTNFYCGASKYIVMYDKNFYTIVSGGSSAFTANPENSYYANTVSGFSGQTTSPSAAWPATFVNNESSLYKYTATTFSAGSGSANGGYPTVLNDGKWLFSFKLQVNAGAIGSGRIFMDDRWTRNFVNTGGAQYFFCCANANAPSTSGNSIMDFTAFLAQADRTVSIGATVNFDLNGGSGTIPAAQAGATGTVVALPPQNDINRQHYNFSGWALTPDATQALESYSIPEGDATLYAVWSRVPVSLAAKAGSATVINTSSGFICGLEAGITKTAFESDYIAVSGNGRLEYSSESSSLGTGIRVDLVDNETQAVLETYTIIIFGDVNGDGNIDGNDAGTITDFENYALTWNETEDAALYFAGDLNNDLNVDSNDAGIIIEVENYTMIIDQITGTAALIP